MRYMAFGLAFGIAAVLLRIRHLERCLNRVEGNAAGGDLPPVSLLQRIAGLFKDRAAGR